MGQICFEIFDFLVMVKGLLGQSIFFFNLKFFFGVWTQVKPGQSESNLDQRVNSVGDDVFHDVTLLRTRVTRAAHVARVSSAPTVWRVRTCMRVRDPSGA